MKLKVFADRSGKIVATFRPASQGKDAPSNVRMDVDGAHEHEIEVPDDLVAPESIHRLHSEYRVDLTGPTAKLVKPK